MLFASKRSDDSTVVDMLASALRRDISFGVLPPDHKLKLASLRARYGGSTHSLRETLRLLEAEGLVEATAQRGFRVTSATWEDRNDILLVRTEIERAALLRAMERGDVRWEARVVAAHHALQKAEDAVRSEIDDTMALEWDEACRVFSASLASACGSPRLIGLQARLFNQSRRFRLAQLREDRLDFDARKARQRRLLEAVLSRDTAGAWHQLELDIAAELKD